MGRFQTAVGGWLKRCTAGVAVVSFADLGLVVFFVQQVNGFSIF